MSNTASNPASPTTPLLITPGDPAGIGPDICLSLALNRPPEPFAIVADPALLEARAKVLGVTPRIQEWQPGDSVAVTGNALSVLPVPCPAVTAGSPDPNTGGYVLQTLQAAVDLCHNGQAAALVTGPVSKQVIASQHPGFTGHTEWLAQATGAEQSVMMLATDKLRVALVTTHLPLSAVPAAITREQLLNVGRILYTSMQQRFGIARPRILVAGLNPHAGEGGLLGREELEVIEPALKTLADNGIPLHGPLPGDTLFTPENLAKADAFLAMYHDQGLAVVKHAGFGEVVNLTLGLPIVRTSVDHGTAFDLAGTGKASDSSLRQAMRWAAALAAGKAPA